MAYRTVSGEPVQTDRGPVDALVHRGCLIRFLEGAVHFPLILHGLLIGDHLV